MLFKVLSEQVAHALERTKKEDVSETIKFVRYMDKFFDCLNVTNFNSGIHKKKRFQEPYTSKNDFRLKVYNYLIDYIEFIQFHFLWLKDDFLGYLKSWEDTC